jgi:myo-inositol-1(or 4)-monophosphatase
MEIDHPQAWEEMVALIRKLGAMAKDEQRRVRYELKEDGTCVTGVDRRVEAELRAGIQRLFPRHTVLGEEGGFSGPRESPWTWVIDPIDGTTNYVAGLPVWAVSVGLLHDRRPHWGCIYVPVLDQLYLAERGRGATCNGASIGPLARTELIKQDLLGITSKGAKKYVYAFPQKVRAMGSAAAQAVFVASGHYVGYLLDVWYIWDIAAALAIALEAGVTVTDISGNSVTEFAEVGSEKGAALLFATPGLHGQLLPLIKEKHLR